MTDEIDWAKVRDLAKAWEDWQAEKARKAVYQNAPVSLGYTITEEGIEAMTEQGLWPG